MFIGIRTLLLNVTRGFGYHSPPTYVYDLDQDVLYLIWDGRCAKKSKREGKVKSGEDAAPGCRNINQTDERRQASEPRASLSLF